MKGETPPTLRRKRFVRKMTKVTRDLKEDGKYWVNKHLKRRDSQGSSSDSDGEKHPMEDRSIEPVIVELQGSSKLWMGKDYTNFIVKDFADLESPFTG